MKSKEFKKNKFKKSAGMTLFIAVGVMAVLLMITFAAVGIAIKSSLFASLGRDSQFALYAADAGLECALYYDAKFDSFATSTSGSPITCAGVSLSTGATISGTSTLSLIGGGGNGNQTSVFGFTLNNNGLNLVPYCAIITVRKYYVGANFTTYVKSRGYNTCDTTNPRRVERGIEVTY